MSRITATPSETEARIRARTLRQRRRRVARNVFTFAVISAALVFLALLQRDIQAQRQMYADAELAARALQMELERSGRPPIHFPTQVDKKYGLSDRYVFNLFYQRLLRRHSPVAVCCLLKPVHLFLNADGRYVVLFDGKRFGVRWMTEAQLRASPDELGCGMLIE